MFFTVANAPLLGGKLVAAIILLARQYNNTFPEAAPSTERTSKLAVYRVLSV